MKKLLIIFFAFFSTFRCESQVIDSLQLSEFMDGVVHTHLRDKHIVGASVTVVQNGKVVLARGYGFANAKVRRPVSADSTLFRIGSISKLFVWISVMNLVSQGKLSLDADVNTYLKDFKIPETFPEPVTLKHLMTHTAGFEDQLLGLFARDSSSMKPLGEILGHQLPRRIFQPGEVASYSNHGAAIAAYIVEQVSGRKFNDYVENTILIPMKMHFTTFRQPLPGFLKPMMSKGYSYSGNDWIEKPFEFVPLYPIGGASASAQDMARFMTALLDNGKYKGNSIIDSATLHFMETPAHRHHPAVNPMLYGIMDFSRNGVSVIGHGGDTFWFHSLLALFPESQTGLFFSFNTDSGGSIADDFLEEFTNRYFPQRLPLKKPIAASSAHMRRFAGTYRYNRYNRHDVTSIVSMFSDVKIDAIDSTRLRVKNGDKVEYYVPIDSLAFREENSSDVIAFKSDSNGTVSRMFPGNFPAIALDRISGVGRMEIQRVVILLVLGTTVIMVIFWPIVSRGRKGYEKEMNFKPLPPGAKWVAWINYLLLGGFYAGTALTIGNPYEVVYGVPPAFKAILVIPFLVIFLTIIMYLQLYRILNQHRYSTSGRLFYLWITIVSTAALWQLYYWNYIGYNF